MNNDSNSSATASVTGKTVLEPSTLTVPLNISAVLLSDDLQENNTRDNTKVVVIILNLVPMPIFITIPIAVGLGVGLMILFKVTHPPAGGNPIIVIIGSVSLDYLINPIITGSIIVLAFGIIINRFILKKKYPN